MTDGDNRANQHYETGRVSRSSLDELFKRAETLRPADDPDAFEGDFDPTRTRAFNRILKTDAQAPAPAPAPIQPPNAEPQQPAPTLHQVESVRADDIGHTQQFRVILAPPAGEAVDPDEAAQEDGEDDEDEDEADELPGSSWVTEGPAPSSWLTE